MEKKARVLVAMSGGIDSTVAAIMLQEQGYDLVGITMKTYDYDSTVSKTSQSGCCSLDSINDARLVAVNMSFPHFILDLRSEFEEHIISDFTDEYMHGRTPNPCVLCNTHVKWSALLKKADQLQCQYIATGHYANVRLENERYVLSKGKDENKDQSYVLWGLSQENLARTLFPLGSFTKDKIREIARSYGLNEIAEKRESYEICFVPDNNYRDFLKFRIPDIDKKIGEGDYVFNDGKVIGKHQGFPYYTIGQRKGLGIALGFPAFVTKIDSIENKVYIGTKDDLLSRSLFLKNYNPVKYAALPDGKRVLAKIRYKDKGTMAIAKILDDTIQLQFDENVTAIAPGQSAVLYEGDDVVGGGFII
ncbi:MAG: tRNA 2-thiouridine(34) synthase MnmA [Bacteroidota bacterium]